MYLRRVKIRSYEKGLHFKDKEFKKLLSKGTYWVFDPSWKTRINVVSMREPWFTHKDLDLIISSGQLEGAAKVLELTDTERGLVWIDNRFEKLLVPGQYVLWEGLKKLKIETVDINEATFLHKDIKTIAEADSAKNELITYTVDEGFVGMLFLDGNMSKTLTPGKHVFWRKSADVKILHVDLRESVLDVSGQEIITKDKVTLRLNGLTTYKVIEPEKAVTVVENYIQSLYRETQLALRAIVGTWEIDTLLADKDTLATKVRDILERRVSSLGLKIVGFGVRDIILPGDMKELLNKVVESRKAAEANLITRREETAAMRSQANTAKILESNPTLMRLRELELLEKVAASSKLKIICGDGPLTDNVVKLI